MYIMGNSLINIIGKEIMKNETKTIYNEFKEYAGELYKSEWDNHILNKK